MSQNNQKISYDRGLIKTIILIVIGLILLGTFGFRLREIMTSPVVLDNLNYAKEIVLDIWNNFLKVPVNFIWNIILNLIMSNNKTGI